MMTVYYIQFAAQDFNQVLCGSTVNLLARRYKGLNPPDSQSTPGGRRSPLAVVRPRRRVDGIARSDAGVSAAGWGYLRRTFDGEASLMLHSLVLASGDMPMAAGFILRGIKGIFVAIGSIIAAIVCAVIAGAKGRSAIG